ncbi:ABC transporter permease [Kyrpidia spormannii]|uniref:ABC transporter permease n=1 Tax=Kyrpidia spormannii TaxID=2055160 RepID=A0A2K8NCA9_9BACL|nr:MULTISPECIES: ABC transporter permease [Kyrpidia]ATY86170.1 ABC transporter permease [Kyrpidia spormannii]MCL6577323.1 ABC transporter permease [Kyrpidia sp.]
MIGVILRKELLDLFRDRKTWMAAVILPIVLWPALILLMVNLQVQSENQARQNVPIAIQGHQSRVEEALWADGHIQIVQPADPLGALRAGDVRAIVRIDDQFDNKIAHRQTATVTVVYNASNSNSQAAYDLVNQRLQALRKHLEAERLWSLGLTEQAVTPLAITGEDASTQGQKAGSLLGFIIPLMLILSTATGAMPAATDFMAGEKERGTLEALLTTPASARSILLGKMAATAVMGAFSGVISVVVMMVTFSRLPAAAGAAAGTAGEFARSILTVLTPGLAVVMLMMILLVALLFAALMLTVSSYAKSFKESQTYMTPFVLVAAVAGYMVMFAAPDALPGWYFVVPFVNVAALMKELLYGIMNAGHAALVIGSLAVYTAGAVALSAAAFGRESLVVRG